MTSKFTINLIVGFLGMIAMLTIVGGFILALDGKTIPDALIALGSASLGALGSLLARTSSEPLETTIVNTASEPIPTTATLEP